MKCVVKPFPNKKNAHHFDFKKAVFKECAELGLAAGPLLFCNYFNNYYIIRMGWFFSVLPVLVDDSGADSFVICSSVVCRGSSCTGWRCSGLKFSWLWSFLTRQGKLFRLLFVCNYCCRGKKNICKYIFIQKDFFSFPCNDQLQFTNLGKLLILYKRDT